VSSPQHTPVEPRRAARPPYRPPIGIPLEGEKRWRGVAASVALHALVLVLLLLPVLLPTVLPPVPESAGGPGPAGGGGGGRGGTGGERLTERLRFIQVAPAPPVPKAATQPAVVPLKVTPPPKPVPTPVPVPPPAVQPAAATPAPAAPTVAAATPGTGGGTGNDGTAGSGPGSGGGVGSGVGTGRGSGTGSGTGGGNGTIYTPVPIELFIPPIPVPDRVKGFELEAVFDVDERGKVLSFDFNPTKDGSYNKKLHDVLASIRWRPATTPDGTPIRARAKIGYTL
jgi:protein TonB